uniref:Uncharacterized protein n=1 Tax=Rhizophora mucronata TaxID=61149 RepID=A0A2P2NYY5_RHIMU
MPMSGCDFTDMNEMQGRLNMPALLEHLIHAPCPYLSPSKVFVFLCSKNYLLVSFMC